MRHLLSLARRLGGRAQPREAGPTPVEGTCALLGYPAQDAPLPQSFCPDLGGGVSAPGTLLLPHCDAIVPASAPLAANIQDA